MVFKKAYSLYHQTAALLVVLVILTASVIYVIISLAGLPPESDNLVDISYPCPEDPRCGDTGGEIAAIQDTEIQITNCEIPDSETAITPNEKEMFNLINNHRQQNGLPALSLSQGLSKTAAWLSHDMAEKDVLSHTDSLGRSPSQRVGDCGYSAYKAENIAMNTRTDPTATFEGWRNSPGHNANMLGDAKFIGIAEWRIGGKSYWTTDFGASSDGNWDGGNPGPQPTQPSSSISPTQSPSPTVVVSAAPSMTVQPTTPAGGILGSNLSCNVPASNQSIIFGDEDEEEDEGNSSKCRGRRCPPSSPSPSSATPSITITSGEPSPTAAITQPAIQTAFALDIALPGIGSDTSSGKNSTPINSPVKISVNLLDLENQKIKTFEGNLSFDTATGTFKGSIPLSDVAAGTYKVKIGIGNSLCRQLTQLINITANTSVQAPRTELVTGDVNQDNQLSLLDYNAILSCYGSRSCSQKGQTDLNFDGLVDEKDLNIFYSGLAKRTGD